MSLITDLETLDYAEGGVPFSQFAPSTVDTLTLDYEAGGMPFYAQDESELGPLLFEPTANVVLVTAPTALRVRAGVLKRAFPLLREERVAFSQPAAHTVPAIDFQDTSLIP